MTRATLHLLTEADEICAAHQLRKSHPSDCGIARAGTRAFRRLRFAALAAHRRFHSLQMQINSGRRSGRRAHSNRSCAGAY